MVLEKRGLGNLSQPPNEFIGAPPEETFQGFPRRWFRITLERLFGNLENPRDLAPGCPRVPTRFRKKKAATGGNR